MAHRFRNIDRQDHALCVTEVSTQGQIPFSLTLSWVFLLLLALPGFAQSDIPDNASKKSFGSGWECNLGFRVDDQSCAAITVPKNAFATNQTYGTGWECLHGFIENQEAACIEVAIPDGGYLDATGERWRCSRGYRKMDDTCQQIVLPENAFLTDETYGSDWACARGFKAEDETCLAIQVPENAFLNSASYGTPWTCKRGYLENGDLCEIVTVPENAYFYDASYGNRWKCKRGFSASDSRCDPIELPANAHLNRSGNGWDCHKSFRRKRNTCAMNN